MERHNAQRVQHLEGGERQDPGLKEAQIRIRPYLALHKGMVLEGGVDVLAEEVGEKLQEDVVHVRLNDD